MEVKEGGIKEEGIKDVDFFKRKGRFKICDLYNMVRNCPNFVSAIFSQGIIIIDMEQHAFNGEVIYTGIWKKFSLVEIGQTVPIYDLIWNEETGEVFVGTKEYDATRRDRWNLSR